MSGGVISLNVGGTVFVTSVATLTQYPNSMLAAMFNPESERPPAMKDGQGNYFIDRDPKPFDVILSFLRSAKLREDIVGCTLKELEWEADFFGLEELLKIIEKRSKAEKRKKAAENMAEAKRKKVEEEKEKEGPKMSPLEYKEKAAEMRQKWAEALKLEEVCEYEFGDGESVPECARAARDSADAYRRLAREYESKGRQEELDRSGHN